MIKENKWKETMISLLTWWLYIYTPIEFHHTQFTFIPHCPKAALADGIESFSV
jgi:hypothetical protein